MNRRDLLGRSGVALAVAGGLTGVVSTAGAAIRPAVSEGLQVEAVQMPAWITRNGERIPLNAGDSVATSQEVETAADAGLVLKMPEGSLIRLGEKTHLGIRKLEVSPTDGRIGVRSDLKLFDGFFRFATSTVAKAVGTREIEVSLRTSTVGVRGTDFWSMTDNVHDAVCMFEGKVDVTTKDQGVLQLEQPSAFWARFFERPAAPVGIATPAELAKFINSAEMKPGHGIAVVGGRWRVVAGTFAAPGAAIALRLRLRAEGYPAQIATRPQNGRPMHQVRLDYLATTADATYVLDRIKGIDGVNGRVAMSA